MPRSARSVQSSSQSIKNSARRGGGVPPVATDPVDPVEVGEHQDVEKLGAWNRTDGIQTADPLQQHRTC
jgi:hypothetical protein